MTFFPPIIQCRLQTYVLNSTERNAIIIALIINVVLTKKFFVNFYHSEEGLEQWTWNVGVYFNGF